MRFPIAVAAVAIATASCSLPPNYIPGSLAAAGAAEAAPVRDGGWLITGDGTRLYLFETGQGRPAIVIPGGPGVAPAEPWAGLVTFEDTIPGPEPDPFILRSAMEQWR